MCRLHSILHPWVLLLSPLLAEYQQLRLQSRLSSCLVMIRSTRANFDKRGDFDSGSYSMTRSFFASSQKRSSQRGLCVNQTNVASVQDGVLLGSCGLIIMGESTTLLRTIWPKNENLLQKKVIARISQTFVTNRTIFIVLFICITTLATLYRPENEGNFRLDEKIDNSTTNSITRIETRKLGNSHRHFQNVKQKESSIPSPKSFCVLIAHGVLLPNGASNGILLDANQQPRSTKRRNGLICS
jgi:hypothetical protein